MAEDTTAAPPALDKPETRAEAEERPESSDFWLRELSAAGKRDEGWIKRARKVVQRYRDERRDRDQSTDKRANILWSNTELLKAALFQGLGNPDVRRRFPKRGSDEKVTKQAALVMERSAAYSNDAYDCEGQVEACVEDMVLPGRGQSWIVYDAEFTQNEETGEEEIKYQSVKDEHLYWEDYRTSAGREEKDLWWKARKHAYGRDELKSYFPQHWDKVPLNATLVGSSDDKKQKDDDTFRRACVWEIWDKQKKQRIYVAEDYPLVLKREDDPYRLKEFFPCPEPLYGCKTTSDLEPIPEFTLYQDQADELDVISTRLAVLIEALKRRGVYDASMEGPDNQLSRLALAKDNEFVPFKGFAGLQEKGGLAGIFQTEDLRPTGEAIDRLTARGVILIQQIYEITGISDIMRGASDSSETATAQSIKANFGSMRLQKRQKRVQRFIRDIVRLKAEIAAEHFSREQLVEMTGIEMPLQAEKQQAMQMLAALEQQAQLAKQMQAPPQGGPPQMGGTPQMMGHNGGPMMGMQPPPPPPPEKVAELQRIAQLPTWEEVAAILRSDERRCYKIDVETDQTAQADEQEEKKNRIEFLSTMQTMMEKTIPLVMQMPAMLPLVKESTMFLVKGFKAGRTLEESFDEAFSSLEKMPPQKAPNPEMMKIQAQKEAQTAELQFKQATASQDAQLKKQQFDHERQLRDAEASHQMQLEQYKLATTVDLENKKMAAEQQRAAAELQHKQALAETEYALKAREYEQASLLKEREFAHNERNTERQFEFEREKFGHQQSFEREKFGHQASMDTGKVQSEADNSAATALKHEIAEAVAAQQEAISQMGDIAQVVEGLMQSHQELIKQQSTPKRVIRDPKTNRVVGVESGGVVKKVVRDTSGRASHIEPA